MPPDDALFTWLLPCVVEKWIIALHLGHNDDKCRCYRYFVCYYSLKIDLQASSRLSVYRTSYKIPL